MILRRNKQAGFTLIEVLLSATILAVLARSLVQLSGSMGAMSQSGSSISLLQFEAAKGQDAIIRDLRQSGLHAFGGKTFPHTFEDGLPGVGFEDHAHVPAPQSALPGEPDFGAHHSLVFLMPSDADDDERPDLDVDLNGTPELDANGDGVYSEDVSDVGAWDPDQHAIDYGTGLVWGLAEWRYVVVRRGDGRNYLERQVPGERPVRIAKDVERLSIESPAETGFQIPTNALRFTLFLRRTDTDGAVYRHSVQWVVSLRNGDLE